MQLTVKDVARLLNVSEKSIYRWIQQGEIPVYKVQDQYRFNRSELLEWATQHKTDVPLDLFTETEEEALELPTLTESLRSGGIHFRVDGAGRATVLREVLRLMPLPPNTERDFLLKILLAREEMASTAIGDGIALPHVRNPMILRVKQPLVSLCFLERAVDFAALDGQPVLSLFTLITPNTRVHLHLLSRLGFALKDTDFRQFIVRQAPREEIFAALETIETRIAASRKPPAGTGL